MRVCLGGTFDLLHVGHEALLGKAFAFGAEEVIIGITSDRMASEARDKVSALAVRRRNLEAFLRKRGWRGYRISVLEDVAGPAAYEEDIDAIVVSEERVVAAHAINRKREESGRRVMEIVPVPMVLAEDCAPISARRIRAGEVDNEGRMKRPLAVRVGSKNRVKVMATRRAFSAMFHKVRVRGVAVESEVADQPFGADTVEGAIARARGAIGTADYGVGIEAGLFRNEGAPDYMDVQYCAIVDKRGAVTVGHGPGFRHPPEVVTSVKEGKTVGEAIAALAGVRDIGKEGGAIGWLSRGAFDRKRLTEDAVFMALVPRVRRDLYFR